MLPYFHIEKYQKPPENPKKKFLSFFQPIQTTKMYCFEQYLMHYLESGKRDMDDLLQNYPMPNFPENIRKQFLQQCKTVAEPFLNNSSELIRFKPLWNECNSNASHAVIILDRIPEAGKANEWMIKLLKIFILGMIPDVNKRKKGQEFRDMLQSHLYQFSPDFIYHQNQSLHLPL